MRASHSAVILIAKNGSGKTTLLGALDAFLNCQFGRLANIEFEVVKCRLKGFDGELVLTSKNLEDLLRIPDSSEFLAMVRRTDVDASELLDFLIGDYSPHMSFSSLEEGDVARKIWARYGYRADECLKALAVVAESIKGEVPEVDHVRDVVRKCLDGIEVVYLPTYRRIELALSESVEEARAGRRRASVQSRLGISKKSLFNTEIQFGLRDISDRLSQLNNQMLFDSNQGYREISAKIINDLLDGTFDRGFLSIIDRPSKESLELFFSRLQEGTRFIGSFGRVDIPNFEKIYAEGAGTDASNKFLNYFLGKLNSVILATRSIEGLVEDFVGKCNGYLGGAEGEDGDGSYHLGRSIDDKTLEIDRLTLQVHVVSRVSGRQVPMDSLSSGEKQMVSLFAKLYLYEGKKIVLIDEPELSLSIDWQRKILLDVVEAPTCAQLVAITHSPFVFDNDLEPYARPLMLKISREGSSREDSYAREVFNG
ncbi:ATP-binding protein [Stenotrophomonas maltophilia]|nr:ATP-binding protein [Stenotrophomonas maltophilia]